MGDVSVLPVYRGMEVLQDRVTEDAKGGAEDGREDRWSGREASDMGEGHDIEMKELRWSSAINGSTNSP